MKYTLDDYLALEGGGLVAEDIAPYGGGAASAVSAGAFDAVVGRAVSAVIDDAMRYFPVITVTGPRQSGKTTLIRSHFRNLTYYSMEDLDTRALALSDPVTLLNRHPEGMILDEVQMVPGLLSYIQGIVDNDRSRRFILSGSNNFALLRSVTQSLAGRCITFELLPMALAEVQPWASRQSVDDLLYDGLFPAVCTRRNVARYMYPAYVKTYMERDMRDLAKVRDLMLFRTFVRLCAGRIGQVFNASELANEVGVSANTIQSWLSLLLASYLVYLLPPYFENTRKRLTKSPKLYFVDTGLACSLLGIGSAAELSSHAMRGHLFENLVVMEAYKRRLNLGDEPNLYFYRDSNQNEVDLLELTPAGIHAYEIKSAATYSEHFERALRMFPKWVKRPVVSRTVVYAGTKEREEGEIRVVNFNHF